MILILAQIQTHNSRGVSTCCKSRLDIYNLFNSVTFDSDSIVPDISQFVVTERKIELTLIKANPQIKWKRLEGHTVPLLTPGKAPPLQMNDSSNGGWINNLDTVQEEKKTFQFSSFSLSKKPVTIDHLTLNDNKLPINPGASPELPINPGASPEPPINSGTTPTNPKSNDEDELDAGDPSKRISHFFRLSPDLFSDPSLTGLSNMGNTCFMSSIIQCLSNTIEVRDYFLGGKYNRDLNTVNPLGSQGKLAECFSAVINKLWSGKYQYFPPKKLKVCLVLLLRIIIGCTRN